MGASQVTVQNLQIVDLDEAKGLIMVKGAVPGFDGNVVVVKDAVKRPVPADVPMPAGLKAKAEAHAEQVVADVAADVPVVETTASEEVKE